MDSNSFVVPCFVTVSESTVHHSKYNKVFKAVITNDYRLNVSNGTASEQSTEGPVIHTSSEDLPTPVQLKDFGMFAKNRRV